MKLDYKTITPFASERKPESGDLFNPHLSSCGLYVADIVQLQPAWVLTQGQKVTYRLLVQLAKRQGCCYPSFKYMAAKLGRSVRQAKYDVDVLVKCGLIQRTRRGKQQSNVYQFVWSEIFEVEPTVKCNLVSSEVQSSVRREVQSVGVKPCKDERYREQMDPEVIPKSQYAIHRENLEAKPFFHVWEQYLKTGTWAGPMPCIVIPASHDQDGYTISDSRLIDLYNSNREVFENCMIKHFGFGYRTQFGPRPRHERRRERDFVRNAAYWREWEKFQQWSVADPETRPLYSPHDLSKLTLQPE